MIRHAPASRATTPSAQDFPPVLALVLQLADLLLKLHDNPLGLVDGCYEGTPLSLPPVQSLQFRIAASFFGFDLLAEPALRGFELGCIDESHAARFTGAILVIALVGETGPVPVSA